MRARNAVMTLLVLGWVASAVPSEAREGEPAPSSEADGRERSRAMFRKGVGQLRAQDWAAARTSFEAAWQLFPHPSILLNLGIARLRTEDPVRAEQDLVRFLSEDGGASADELASAREALAEARARLGTLRIVASPAGARVAVDGHALETVRRADAGGSRVVAEVRAKPGRHAITIEAEGHVSATREVDVAAKGDAVVTVDLARASALADKPAAQGPSTRAVVGFTLAGLAGAALITGGITALRARSLADGYADPASARYQDPDARSEGLIFRSTADVMLGLAILGGGTAAILLFTDLGKGATDVARRGAVLRW
jgi:hypothetical protein